MLLLYKLIRMGNTKLTLTLKKEVIDQAKKYASERERSLSDLVENYFKFLTATKTEEKAEELSPKVKRLRGIIKVNPDFNYKSVLDEMRNKKHGA